jgi:hypothetical protein
MPRCPLWRGDVLSSTFNVSHPNPDNDLRRASVIGLYTSYAAPIFLRITSGRDKLVPGPFSLGKWFIPIGAVAVVWVSFIDVLLIFPSIRPVHAQNMSEFQPCFRRLSRNPTLQTTRLSSSWPCSYMHPCHGFFLRGNGSQDRCQT